MGDDSFDTDKARGLFSKRSLVLAAGKKQPLNDLAEAIHEAKREVQKSDEVQYEDLIGLLRYEANSIETAYIRALERQVELYSEMSEEELTKVLLEKLEQKHK